MSDAPATASLPFSAAATRSIYGLVVVLLLPWALLHLLWRSIRQPDYLRHWGERFSVFPKRKPEPTLWLHAVSVGETRAAQPLVAALAARFPDHRILLTHMTPTGRATSEAIFGDRVERCYLPYDTPWAMRRFLRHFRPRLGLIMETELWPNMIAACRQADVPLLLVNARLSERSARRYASLPSLTRPALQGLTRIAAQSEEDGARLAALGGLAPVITGNLKFDIAPPADQLALARTFRAGFGGRPVWLAGSTREGEEALILTAWAKNAGAEALLIIVPRHPQRFDEVARLISAAGFSLQRRSETTTVAPDTQVLLGDSMGEMFAWYAAADVAYVGGSLLDFGGQNLIEPCAAGTPVVIGPYTRNFAEAAREATACGAAARIEDADRLVALANDLLTDPERCQRMGEAGRAFATAHRGATGRTLALIEDVLQQS